MKFIKVDLKRDSVFKNIYLREEGRVHMCSIISKLYNLDYNDLIKNLKIYSSEHPRIESDIKSSYSDIVYMYKDKLFIIEMNNKYYEKSIYKNHFYLLFRHVFNANNKNDYNMKKETYLIDIDNFDVREKLGMKKSSKLVTHGSLRIEDDNICIYKNIKTTRINLEALREKLYNGDVLNDIEEDCIIFIEKDKEKLKKQKNYKVIEGVIKMLEVIEVDGKYFPVFNEEEWQESLRQEMRERGLKEGREEGLEQGLEQGIEQGTYNAKLEIAKNLLKNNFSIDDIKKFTGLDITELDNIKN